MILPLAFLTVLQSVDCATDEIAARLAPHLDTFATRPVPEVRPRVAPPPPAALVTVNDLFPYEDSASVLLSNYNDLQLIDLMADAANALMVAHGDQFDFIGYWLDFEPHHTIGLAFYLPVTNDVTGIGNPFQDYGQPPLSDFHSTWGLAGATTQGLIMCWNVNGAHWQPGTGPGADFTRLALQHEIEHRFACYLSPLAGGKALQGDFLACGSGSHWNWKVDSQGGCLSLADWVGSAPAVPAQLGLSFNTDIPGGTYSYTDLYLMGMVSPGEMDAGNSELRYMDTSDCGNDYFGAITDFTSADIVAANGARSPSSAGSQKAFRMGWIMLHLPGSPPSNVELQKAADMLAQSSMDFEYSTLGIGSINHTLPGPTWEDLGAGLAGTHGVPSLTGTGTLIADDPLTVTLTGALESATAFLLVGFDTIFAPFKGGVIVPDSDPPGFILTLGTDPSGDIVLNSTWPAGAPSEFTTYLQYWVQDLGGPKKFSASNALGATTP